ncbi:unnamed protein product, partial [Choristocarpus tenellus]
MAEICHVCDLFRTALFGATNTAEDHLDNGEDDLPSPMADAPATLRAPKASKMVAENKDSVETAPVSSHSHGHSSQAMAQASAQAREPAPNTKFKKKPTRALRNTPAYMSFDDVDIADDESDCEIFMDDEELHRRNSVSNLVIPPLQQQPSVYRAPVRMGDAVSATTPVPAPPLPPPPNSTANDSALHPPTEPFPPASQAPALPNDVMPLSAEDKSTAKQPNGVTGRQGAYNDRDLLTEEADVGVGNSFVEESQGSGARLIGSSSYERGEQNGEFAEDREVGGMGARSG